MRIKLIAFALPLCFAASAMATKPMPNAEQIDKMKKGQDDAKAKADHKRAQALYKQAGEYDKRAHNYWVAAGKLWQSRQDQLHKMHDAQATARSLRRQASLLNIEAHRLFRAEQLRQGAYNYRVRADRYMKSAYTHTTNVNVAKKAIESGNHALKDLAGVASKFADAIKDIKKDIAAQQNRVKSEEKLAAADKAAANKDLETARKLETQAAALEKPVVAIPKIVVKALPAPAKIKIAPVKVEAAAQTATQKK